MKDKPKKLVITPRLIEYTGPLMEKVGDVAYTSVICRYYQLNQIDVFVGGPAPLGRVLEVLKDELSKGKRSVIKSVSIVEPTRREMKTIVRIVSGGQ